ncbi:MAG: hypothetical protein ACFFA6_17495 [Promethearchaeota archaeon]
MSQGLAAVLAIGDEEARAKTLAALEPVAPDQPAISRHIRQALAEHLWRNLQHQTRSEVLQFCADSTLFPPPVLDPTTLAVIAGHIIEVCTQWQWP